MAQYECRHGCTATFTTFLDRIDHEALCVMAECSRCGNFIPDDGIVEIGASTLCESCAAKAESCDRCEAVLFGDDVIGIGATTFCAACHTAWREELDRDMFAPTEGD